jgi:hypothetical protein
MVPVCLSEQVLHESHICPSEQGLHSVCPPQQVLHKSHIMPTGCHTSNEGSGYTLSFRTFDCTQGGATSVKPLGLHYSLFGMQKQDIRSLFDSH